MIGNSSITNNTRTAVNPNMEDKCGICEQIVLISGTVYWYSPYSVYAHQVCYNVIKEVERNLVTIINSKFVRVTDQNNAHRDAISAIKNVLRKTSIKTCLHRHGAEKLKKLFNSAGVEAATFHKPNS